MIRIIVQAAPPVAVRAAGPARVALSVPGAVLVQGGAAPVYGGSYSVRPEVEAQSLPTAGRLMRQDLEVQGVPIYDVGNSAGGRTVYIAKKMEVI